MTAKQSLGRNERLKSRKIIEQLFKDGRGVSAFPIRVSYRMLNGGDQTDPRNNATGQPGDHLLQAGFSASSRNFKKATDRNRIKRLLREAYRKQKTALYGQLATTNRRLAIFIIFTGKELPEYAFVEEKMKLALNKLSEHLNNTSTS